MLDATTGPVADPAATNPLEAFTSTEELQQYFLDNALQQWEYLFGQPAWGGIVWYETADGNPVMRDPVAMNNATGTGSGDYSGTNNQVAGVDEADIVKTDGEFLYILGGDQWMSGRELVIVDAQPGAEIEVASRTPLPGWAIAQYLDGDRLTVISQNYGDYFIQTQTVFPTDRLGGVAADVAIWPGPMVRSRLTVTVFDVSDRSAPTIDSETIVDGSYIDSRKVGDNIYLVVSNNFALPQPEMVPLETDPTKGDPGPTNGKPQPFPDPTLIVDVMPGAPVGAIAPASMRLGMPSFWDPGDVGTASYRYETVDEYLARVSGQALELALPYFYVPTNDPDAPLERVQPLGAPNTIYKPTSPDDQNLLTILAFDATGTQDGPVDSTSVVTSYASTVYASTDNLYLLSPDWGPVVLDAIAASGPMTSIYKVSLAQGDVDVTARGTVSGTVLNQFSVDEFDGNLRIATSSGWGANTRNQLFVLSQDGDQLTTIGTVDDLAPGENIFSVRFLGDVGYVVTFLRTDPLFVVDLSDPAAPAVVGELEIPGFSRYLQPISEDYLIGIGRNADASGRTQGLQTSLFDVSDPAHPTLVSRYDITPANSWAWTDAEYDHHAVGYYPEFQILAIPVNHNGSNVFGTSPFGSVESGLLTLHVDATAGIEWSGWIAHDTSVLRSVRIDDLLYSISTDAVKVNEITDPSVQIGETQLRDPSVPAQNFPFLLRQMVLRRQGGVPVEPPVIPAAPSNVDLLASSDTGLADDDNFTADTSPTFRVTADGGLTVEFQVDGVTVATATEVAAGVYEATLVPGTLSVGDNTITATATNEVGTSDPSTELSVTLAEARREFLAGSHLTFTYTQPDGVSVTATVNQNALAALELMAAGTRAEMVKANVWEANARGGFFVSATNGIANIPAIQSISNRFGRIVLENVDLGDVHVPDSLGQLAVWGDRSHINGTVHVGGRLFGLDAGHATLTGRIQVGTHLDGGVLGTAVAGSRILVGGLVGRLQFQNDSAVDLHARGIYSLFGQARLNGTVAAGIGLGHLQLAGDSDLDVTARHVHSVRSAGVMRGKYVADRIDSVFSDGDLMANLDTARTGFVRAPNLNVGPVTIWSRLLTRLRKR